VILAVSLALAMSQSEPLWAPKQAPLMTRWAKEVRADKAHPEYPRPTMVRKDWMNLNGLWELEIKEAPERGPDVRGSAGFKGKILVPFPVESALSGVMKPVAVMDQLEYRRTFELPANWKGKRVLLHFGAVDWSTQVFVNGKEVGKHVGGYDPFSFDVTDALRPQGPHELLVVVRDPTDDNWQPRGKQVRSPEGIWYTPTSGIWQTVWIEPIPAEAHIARLKIEPNYDTGKLRLEVRTSGNLASEALTTVEVFDGNRTVAKARTTAGQAIEVPVAGFKPWSPGSPHLYRLRVSLGDGEETFDSVDSYFAFRKFSLGKDEKGRTKFFLNGKPYFVFGPLDQGFWPDGLYTPPTEAAMKYDLDVTKKFGFNMLRKHVKVESERFYYLCDKMGLLVFQDMPSGDKYIGGRDPDIARTPESGNNFMNELRAMIEARRNHPSIVCWVPFNEGWGQWKTAEATDFVRQLDPNRLIDNPSGWTDRGVGDMHDIHAYPGPASPKPEANRAAFLGEFGGLGLPKPGHMWKSTGWGYQSFKTQEELTDAYVGLLQNLRFLIDDPGLSGAVYTQTTDVEVEVNGLMTYDRAVIKIDPVRAKKAADSLFLPPPKVQTLVPTSEAAAVEWMYTTEKVLSEGFQRAEFVPANWLRGPGGFGTQGTPGAVVRTVWNTPEIWLRREVEVPPGAKEPHLRIHHDEDVEVYLDGELLLSRKGYTTGYVLVPVRKELLKAGKRFLSVHCRQTGGGQYVDVGIVDVVQR
jgi:hypothetical protein